MKRPLWMSLLVAVGVLALDQLSKYAVSMTLPPGGAWSPFAGPEPLFQIVYTYNTNVIFGLFKDVGPIFALIPLIAVIGILVYAFKLRRPQWLSGVALGMMLGGVLGNVMDRIWLGRVIDFIDIGIGPARLYTSNVADLAIMAGIILLGLATIIEESKARGARRRQPLAAASEADRSSNS